MGKIKEIIPDNQGYKVLIIDYQNNAFVLKFDISFHDFELILEIKGKQIYHGCWVEHSTKIFFTTSQNHVLVLDFIDFSLS